MWRAVGDGFTGASPAAPRRAAMAASALRFFTLWRRHDRQRTEPPDSRSAPHGALSTVWAPLPFCASRASVASAGASRAGSGVLRRPASWRKRHQLQPGQMQCLQSGRPAATHSRHLRFVGGLGVTRERHRRDPFTPVRAGARIARRALSLQKRDLATYLLALIKIRLDSVKRMIQIQNTSWSSAATKYFTVTAREHTLAPPGRHRPRHSRTSLTTRQNKPAIDAAI